MRHRRTYMTATQFVDQMVRKYHANRCWIWEVLDELNIIKGIGYVMDRADMIRAEDRIKAYIAE